MPRPRRSGRRGFRGASRPTFGKVLVAAVMFLGRVGSITILVALAARQRPPLYKVPEEDIAIG
jgi:trk system potassium uptake protein